MNIVYSLLLLFVEVAQLMEINWGFFVLFFILFHNIGLVAELKNVALVALPE